MHDQEGSSAEGQGQATSSGRPKRLPNVHVGLQPSGVRGGTMHIIDGSYDYYHYMQVCFLSRCHVHVVLATKGLW